MEISEEHKSIIDDEMPSGNSLKIVVDHCDDEDGEPFRINIGSRDLGWFGFQDLNMIKNVINKAIKLKRDK